MTKTQSNSSISSRKFEFFWIILRFSIILLVLFLFPFLRVPLWIAILISFVFYAIMQLLYFLSFEEPSYEAERMNTVLKGSLFTFFMMFLVLLIEQTYLLLSDGPDDSVVPIWIVFIMYLSIGYSFQKVLKSKASSDTSVISTAIWSISVRFPIFVSFLAMTYAYFEIELNAPLFIISLLLPGISSSLYLGLLRIGINANSFLKRAFNGNRYISTNLYRFKELNTRQLALVCYEKLTVFTIGLLRNLKIYTIFSRISDLHYVKMIKTYQSPNQTRSSDFRTMVKLPLAVSIFTVIFDITLRYYGIYATLDGVSSNRVIGVFVGYTVSFIYKSYLQGLLPKSVEPPTWLVAFFSLSTSIQFLFYFPDLMLIRDTTMIQISVYLGYVLIHAGTYGGALPLILAYTLRISTELIPDLVQFLQKSTNISHIELLAWFSLYTLLTIVSYVIMAYGIYIIIDINLGMPKSILYLLISAVLYFSFYRFSYIVGYLEAMEVGIINKILYAILILGRITAILTFLYFIFLLLSYVAKSQSNT